MSGDFGTMVARIAAELKRSNATASIKDAINDAISISNNERFYFNEVVGASFVTVPGQQYYDDLDFIEIDDLYWFNGAARWHVRLDNNYKANERAVGTILGGSLTNYSRVAKKFRLYPIPTTVVTVYVDGIQNLSPSPLVADADTNNWMTDGEMYIRALAKSIYLRDTVKDYAEAATWEGVAFSIKDSLFNATTSRVGTDTVQSTRF